jgi:hypothetical protein
VRTVKGTSSVGWTGHPEGFLEEAALSLILKA